MQRQIKKLLPARHARPAHSGQAIRAKGVTSQDDQALSGGHCREDLAPRVIDTGHVRPALRLLSMKGLRFNGGKRWQTDCEQSVNYPNSQPAKFTPPAGALTSLIPGRSPAEPRTRA